MNKAVFIDKDGTLIKDVPYNIKPELIELAPDAVGALRTVQDAGYLLIVISNQSGVARGFFTEEELQPVEDFLRNTLAKEGVILNGFYFCPHYEGGSVAKYAIACECRKPLPGMILKAAKDFNIDLSASWMIGDILNDAEAGNRAGCKSILLDNGNETEWIMNDLRKPTFTVNTLTEAAKIIVHQPVPAHA